MALITCKECGGEVSSKAAACPKCGAAPPKRTSLGTWIVGGFFLFVVYQCSSVMDKAYNPAPQSAAAPAAKTDAENREDAELNVAIAAGKVLKAAMKDPASFKVESFVYYPGGAACYEYRGKNSFGAVVPGKAVFDGTKILSSDHDGNRFVKAWNATCTKAGGKERAGGLSLLGVW